MECPKCHTENKEDSRFCGNCAALLGNPEIGPVSLTKTLETPVQGLIAGALLAGKYRVIGEIGQGGMGVVYKAEDIKLKRAVALKFLHSGLESHEPERMRFLQEAQATSALNHPNVCTVYDIKEEGDQQFIVMELVRGG